MLNINRNLILIKHTKKLLITNKTNEKKGQIKKKQIDKRVNYAGTKRTPRTLKKVK